MDPHYFNEHVRRFPFISTLLFRELWMGKKISKFERKSMSHTKLLQHLSYFLSLPFSKEHKGIFVIIYFSLLLDVRTRVKKLEILEGRQECKATSTACIPLFFSYCNEHLGRFPLVKHSEFLLRTFHFECMSYAFLVRCKQCTPPPF